MDRLAGDLGFCQSFYDAGSVVGAIKIRSMAGDFRKLNVWKKGHALAVRVDKVASTIRTARHISLKSQLVRAAMSIPANIAEGRHQDSERDFARFLRYSVNSAYELEYHLVVSQDVGAIPDSEASSMLAEAIKVRKMLHGLLNKLNKGSVTKSAAEQ